MNSPDNFLEGFVRWCVFNVNIKTCKASAPPGVLVWLLRTTVTVRDELRRKLKRLAAMLDVTQGEVIERALRVYEGQILRGRPSRRARASGKVLDAMEEAASKIRRSDPEWARISRTIERAAVSIDEFTAEGWG